MTWYVQKVGASGTRVDLLPVSGSIVVEDVQPFATFDALDGTRTVWQTAMQKPKVTLPQLYFRDPLDVARLRALVASAVNLTLASDYGTTWTVRAVGGMRTETLDTPDRATAPVLLVTLTLVGV